jgi:hypothetical protein
MNARTDNLLNPTAAAPAVGRRRLDFSVRNLLRFGFWQQNSESSGAA